MSLALKKALYNISSLLDLGEETTSSKNFTTRIQSALYVIMGTFLTSRGAIFSYKVEDDSLAMVVRNDFNETGALRKALSSDYLRTLGKNEPFILKAGHDDDDEMPLSFRTALVESGTEIIIPLWVKDEFIGSITLGGKFTAQDYSAEDRELMKIIAHHIAITLNNHALIDDLTVQLEENKRLYKEMRLIYHDTLQAFAAAIDAKDVYTKNHSQRVAKYSVAIARELGMTEMEIEGLYIAGYLHDVGKLIISNDVLNKKDALTDSEFKVLKSHPNLSYDIISKINFPWKDVVQVIKHHHERLDGRGYPDHLSNSDLSDSAKILILADSFDAMTSDRPYRNNIGLQAALEEVKRCLGSQFDPRIVGAFCRVLDKEIRGELTNPDILPHLDKNFDASIITSLLETITEELSA